MTQSEHIIAHLIQGKSITPKEALERFGCFRLGARIYELKRRGFAIATTTICDRATGKHYAEYRLAK